MKKALIYFLLIAKIYSCAHDGTFDSSFDMNGVVITPFDGGPDMANAIVQQPDGKIVVAGFSQTAAGTRNIAIVRYYRDGRLDSSFGSGGIVTTDIGGVSDEAHGVVLQPDAKVVVAGYANIVSRNFAVVRYNHDGSLDSSFGTNGIVITDLGGVTDEADAVLLQPDGKIVAVGFCQVGTSKFAVVRYNADGSLDSSFGTGGIVLTALGTDDRAQAAVLQSDGKIVAAGFTRQGAVFDFGLVRYNTDGSLDSSFGNGGIVTTNQNDDDEAFAVLVQPDGKLVAAGYSGSAMFDFFLVRYNTNGSLDSSFGVDGKVITDVGGNDDEAFAVLLQPDGKIVAAGISNKLSSTDFALARYNTDGFLDRSFGTEGTVVTDEPGFDSIESAVIQANGKILVAGRIDSVDWAVARYLIPSLEISTLARDLRAKYALLQ